MRMQIEIPGEEMGSHFVTDFYEFAAAMRVIANWYQSGIFESYQNSEEYVRIGKEFGTWLAENEYNFTSGHVVIIDLFKEIVEAYEEEMKNA